MNHDFIVISIHSSRVWLTQMIENRNCQSGSSNPWSGNTTMDQLCAVSAALVLHQETSSNRSKDCCFFFHFWGSNWCCQNAFPIASLITEMCSWSVEKRQWSWGTRCYFDWNKYMKTLKDLYFFCDLVSFWVWHVFLACHFVNLLYVFFSGFANHALFWHVFFDVFCILFHFLMSWHVFS